MTKEKLEELLSNHEKITVEYKESKTAIPANVKEIAQLNTEYRANTMIGH